MFKIERPKNKSVSKLFYVKDKLLCHFVQRNYENWLYLLLKWRSNLSMRIRKQQSKPNRIKQQAGTSQCMNQGFEKCDKVETFAFLICTEWIIWQRKKSLTNHATSYLREWSFMNTENCDPWSSVSWI